MPELGGQPINKYFEQGDGPNSTPCLLGRVKTAQHPHPHCDENASGSCCGGGPSSSPFLSDRGQGVVASLGNGAPAHTRVDIDFHLDVHGTGTCLRATPTPASTPHLQVDISHPLEHPLVGPDHGVCVLCLTAGPALLEGLAGTETVGDSGGRGGTLRSHGA